VTTEHMLIKALLNALVDQKRRYQEHLPLIDHSDVTVATVAVQVCIALNHRIQGSLTALEAAGVRVDFNEVGAFAQKVPPPPPPPMNDNVIPFKGRLN
jgi:hypothetical protein